LSPGIIGYFALEIHLDRDPIFLHGDGIVKIAFPIEKLLQPDQGIKSNFLLGLPLGFEHHILFIAIAISIAIADGGHRPLAERVEVNAEARAQVWRSWRIHDCASCCFRILATMVR
jgi:hypothetical protein